MQSRRPWQERRADGRMSRRTGSGAEAAQTDQSEANDTIREKVREKKRKNEHTVTKDKKEHNNY